MHCIYVSVTCILVLPTYTESIQDCLLYLLFWSYPLVDPAVSSKLIADPGAPFGKPIAWGISLKSVNSSSKVV